MEMLLRTYRRENESLGLSLPIKMALDKQSKQKTENLEYDTYPMLSEGVFVGTFNFNLARINHDIRAGNALEDKLQREITNVLFDTNNNRIFTVTIFAKDILDSCNGRVNLSRIIDIIAEKFQMPHSEAESKCKNFLNGLIDKNIIVI